MSTFNKTQVIEILDALIVMLQNKKPEERFKRFLLECIWFRQNINNNQLELPLKTIHNYYLGYVIRDDVFEDDKAIQNLAEKLSEVIQDIDIENF